MKNLIHQPTRNSMHTRRVPPTIPQRRGSALLIVVVLLASLSTLGVLVYGLASQQSNTAEYFSEAAKVRERAEVDRDALMNYALRQLIVGPRDRESQSVLYGGYWSLMANMYGRDAQAYNGSGTNYRWDSGANEPAVDMDLDGANDNPHLIELNQSPAARGSVVNLNDSGTYYPDPDADYTAPDANNPFLFHVVEVPDGAGKRKVLIPSFHRPQILRNVATPDTWYSAANTGSRVFRPHEDHLAIALKADGTSEETTILRYVLDNTEATSLGLSGPFPFPSNGLGDFAAGRLGVWTGDGDNYNVLDVDIDNDGQLDSVYLDLGVPVQFTTVLDEPFIPMVSVKIESADELFNLNANGNAFGTVTDVSKSNHGLSPFEINPTWGLTGDPTVFSGGPELDPHEYFYSSEPVTVTELANQEFVWLLKGRPIYGASALDILGYYTGRHGEKQLLEASMVPWAGTSFATNPLTADDDNNRNIGGTFGGDGIVFPSLVNFPAYQHPIDFKGAGSFIKVGSAGKERDLVALGKHQFPRYSDYLVNPANRYYLASTNIHSDLIMPSPAPDFVVDNEEELYLETDNKDLREDDHIFSAGENAFLHMSNNDITLNGTKGRLSDLAPINFKEDARAAEIRQSYTTTSWDVKSFGIGTHSTNLPIPTTGRGWQFNTDTDSDSHLEFPPTFVDNTGTNDLEPFRLALRQLLAVEEPVKIPGTVSFQSVLQRRLNINQVLEIDPGGRLRFRPLTPHPENLPATVLPVTGPTRPEDVTTIEEQEYLARRDRQLMCRDIYVLLWTLGSPNDADLTSNPSVYTAAEAKRMAQFAVNWVDALDPDDVITAFEFDIDLSDGWHLDDNPFTNAGTGDSIVATDDSDRELVFGLEAQKLALNEGLALFSPEQMTDLTATEFDETKARDFLYLELQNISTENLTFDDRDAYQIAIVPADATSATFIEERRLTLRDGAGSIPSGSNSLFSIGTAGDVENLAKTGDPDYAINTPLMRFRVNPTQGEMPDNGMIQIAPATVLNQGNAAGHLNLFTSSSTTYRVMVPPTSVAVGESEVTSADVPPGEPQGIDLLHFIPVIKDTITAGTVINLRVELRRRMNTGRAAPSESGAPVVLNRTESDDNPWIVVDEMEVPLNIFMPSGNSGSNIRTALVAAQGSTERIQPLYSIPGTANATYSITDPPAYPTNSIGSDNFINGAAPTSYALWQPHFNRDFYSVTELLSLPLYGPKAEDADSSTTFTEDLSGLQGRNLGLLGGAQFDNANTAASLMFDTTAKIDPLGATVGNRWYRLLNFVEHPSPVNRHEELTGYVTDVGRLGDLDKGVYRVPGLIQLNTLRHPGVLAGLIDDRDIIPSYNPLAAAPQLIDADGRDWWAEFLEARDGIDPITGLSLPGVPVDTASAYPAAGPFRSLGTALYGPASVDHTLLRSLPADSGQPDKRRLFETGTLADHTGGASDHTVRNRILGKLLNNTTNRSHVFYVTVQVDFFEAVAVDTMVSGEDVTVYRVGQKRADSPGWRNFFVVDRSKAQDTLQTSDLPDDTATYNNLSFGSSFDYNELILHRQELN